MQKLKFPGEKTGGFSLRGLAKNQFLEKETFKLQVVGKQLVTLQIADSIFNTYTFMFHQSKKTLISAPLIWPRPLAKKTQKSHTFLLFQESSLLEQPLRFLQMNHISMELAW